ncbi:hypothetical protein PISS_a2054 [Pseudoalteromonas issachenkonii]|uniref:Uncharacterized protein n=1 Tax=Pseudoalteromonas issachenkonii TaxID=152297 RepID=A0ABM6N3U7_9GAMM|nr:hypothetical protein PSM_A1845 [Pseudoalteromonas sp. SM9913]ATC90911.1 hypothetical protein PISS_a2054 [Pseudoalteromonas issachenkonii]ATD03481.1 hypothetical protein PTET_a2112 [Pseudoalteromonas tetraodonis]
MSIIFNKSHGYGEYSSDSLHTTPLQKPFQRLDGYKIAL